MLPEKTNMKLKSLAQILGEYSHSLQQALAQTLAVQRHGNIIAVGLTEALPN